MELDLWEGQFKLGDQEQESGLDDDLEEYTGHYTGATCWGEDSSVNMGTVHQLQEAVGRLQEDHESYESSYQNVKQSNDSLMRKIFMLEEVIRDMEVNSMETKQEHERRLREVDQKLELERNKSKDFAIRILELESDNATLLEKFEELNGKLSESSSQQESDLDIDQQKSGELSCFVSEREVFVNQMSRLDKSETDSGCHLQDDHDQELLVSDLQSRLSEMEAELRVARDQNKCLVEQLEKQKSISQYSQNEMSLAQEIKESSHEQSENSQAAEIDDLKKSLSTQEEVNQQLQKYIDTVILSIMEKHPELLEVKRE